MAAVKALEQEAIVCQTVAVFRSAAEILAGMDHREDLVETDRLEAMGRRETEALLATTDPEEVVVVAPEVTTQTTVSAPISKVALARLGRPVRLDRPGEVVRLAVTEEEVLVLLNPRFPSGSRPWSRPSPATVLAQRKARTVRPS